MTKDQFVLLTSVLTLVLCAPIWPRADTRPKMSYVSFQDLRSPRQSPFRAARTAKPLPAPPAPPAAIPAAALEKPRPAQAEAPDRQEPVQALRSRLTKAVSGLKPATAMAAERQSPPGKNGPSQAQRKGASQPSVTKQTPAKPQPSAAKPAQAKPTARKAGSPQAVPSRTS